MLKVVNGVTVECSPEEEVAISAEWLSSQQSKSPQVRSPTIQDVIDILSKEQQEALRTRLMVDVV